MRSLTRVLILIFSCLALAACDGPPHFMSGGKLSGTIVDVPGTWHLPESSALAQLETRPEDPYSINLTYVQMDGRFYFYAGDTRTNWVQYIEQDPRVRIRIGETIYPGQAVRVTSDADLAAFAAVWANLSVFQRDPMELGEVWLYRLEAR